MSTAAGELAIVIRRLARPGPWADLAECLGMDPEYFHPPKGVSTSWAKQICARCEVRPQCLAHALANRERFGVWGGKSERERRLLRREQVA